MVDTGSVVQGKKGTYRLAEKIGDGGEGTVFSVKDSKLVAKLYKKDIAMQEQKLLYMVSNPLPNVVNIAGKRILTLAWPNDVLYDDNGKFIGFVMPRIEEGIEIFEIHRLCTSPKAKRMFPDYTWKLNVEVARNLAVAVNILHILNCIVGDLNFKNILVHADASISVLDTDSFDLTDPQTGTHFKCGVGTDDYLPPELQGGKLRDPSKKYTVYSDYFALAVHIFQLLMGDFHPFTCRPLTKEKHSAGNARLERICQGKSPFIKKYEDIDIPISAPRLAEILPDYICRDFIETFDYTAATAAERAQYRTTAKKWEADLSELLRECNTPGKLISCKDHFYLASKGQCGRCLARQRYEDHQNKSTPQRQTTAPVREADPDGSSPWKVKILGLTDSAERCGGIMELREGSRAFVHFQVTDGIPGQRERFYCQWTAPDGLEPAGQRYSSLDHSVGEMAYVGYLNIEPGTHTLIIRDSYNRQAAQYAFTVSGKPKAASWKVQILCHTDSALDNSRNIELYQGSYAFVHFQVTDGVSGEKGRFYYRWRAPNGSEPSDLRVSEVHHAVGEKGWIGTLKPASGTHTVTIFDGNHQPIAQDTFVVKSRWTRFLGR